MDLLIGGSMRNKISFEKTRPKRLHLRYQSTEKKKYDKPGCCTINNYLVSWNGTYWVNYVEGNGFGTTEVEIHYCPFCGQKLDAQTPAKSDMKDKIKIISNQTLDDEFFSGTFDLIIERLESYRKDGWQGIEVLYDYENTGYQLYKERWETDEEYKKRKSKDIAAKEKRRKKYEELKKEFE
jgi:hypothetical protein